MVHLVIHAPTDREWIVEGDNVSLEFGGNVDLHGVTASRYAPKNGVAIAALWEAGDAVIAAHRSIVGPGGRGYTPESTLIANGQPMRGWHVAHVGD